MQVIPARGTYFVDVELSVLKALNDSIPDKDLVTSLLNMHKDLFFQHFQRMIARRYPDARFTLYSDEKMSSFAAVGILSAELAGFRSDVQRLFNETNQRFAAIVQEQALLRGTDLSPLLWYQAGMGRSSYESALAARMGRQLAGSRRVHFFSDPHVRRNLDAVRIYIDEMRRELDRALNYTPHWDGFTVSEETAARLRKGEAIAGMSAEVLEVLKRYAQFVDEFSPPVRKDKKEIASLSAAEFGGISIDLVGFGGINLRATAAALTMSADLQDALIRVPLGEKWATARMVEQYSQIEQAARIVFETQFTLKKSGDDAVLLFHNPQSEDTIRTFIKALAQFAAPSKKRLSILEPHVAAERRATLGVLGELLEKKLRKKSGSPDMLYAVRCSDEHKRVDLLISCSIPSVCSGDHPDAPSIEILKSALDELNSEQGESFGVGKIHWLRP